MALPNPHVPQYTGAIVRTSRPRAYFSQEVRLICQCCADVEGLLRSCILLMMAAPREGDIFSGE